MCERVLRWWLTAVVAVGRWRCLAARCTAILPRELVPPTLERLRKFVLRSKVQMEDAGDALQGRAVQWAQQAGRAADISPELLAQQSLSDEAIDALVAERTSAKKQRNFTRADQIRNELAEKGIIIEDSKDGVRWRRK